MEPSKPSELKPETQPDWETNDDAEEIRFSLTALGEAVVADRTNRRPFRGFGPCVSLA